MTEPWTWDRVLAETTPPEAAAQVCLRGDLVAAKEAAEQALLDLRRAHPDPTIEEAGVIHDAAMEVQRREAECAAAAVTFRFRGIGRKPHSDLVAKYPPTADQQAEASDQGVRYAWNPETFPPALVAASCIEPAGITLQAAQRIAEQWTDGQWAMLWRACVAANEGTADPGPKSAIASAVLRDYAQN